MFVAHSMGGLVVRAALVQEPERAADTRAVATVGTPFLGSAKSILALNLLNTGGGRPGCCGRYRRWRRHCRASTTCCPTSAAWTAGWRWNLTPGDVARFGGNHDLAARSLGEHARHRESGFVLPGHRAIVGEAQAPVQTLDEQQRAGLAVAADRRHAFDIGEYGELVCDPATGIPARRDASGDGTVHIPPHRPVPWHQPTCSASTAR
ncbi:hypothetical protein [Kitasatospora indigofera]|uniref:hypothetical protein n=1 Tax=Kitasatospora indigofera TaxID=67307 RepID=UPI0033BBE0DD